MSTSVSFASVAHTQYLRFYLPLSTCLLACTTGDCSHIVLSLKKTKLACKWQYQDKPEGECTIHLGCVIAGVGQPAISCRVVVPGNYQKWPQDLMFPIDDVEDAIFNGGQCRDNMHITVYGSSQ